jgi:hypothetical protein
MGAKLVIAILLVGGALAELATPAETQVNRYYMVVLASQRADARPRASHTFAVFVRTRGERVVETHSVSWMPATLVIMPLRRTPEPGRNLTLRETLQWARSVNAGISVWGPYEVRKELYDRALKLVERLNSGKVSYIALDGRFRGNGATNCIHAIGDLDTEKGMLETGFQHGVPATALVVRHLQRWMVRSAEKRSDILAHLGLSDRARFIHAERESH